ncbi:hypothetical protein HQN90_10850 [Paenibacillus alba]|nr:hypothetical protein [Paenibacillus alba]
MKVVQAAPSLRKKQSQLVKEGNPHEKSAEPTKKAVSTGESRPSRSERAKEAVSAGGRGNST